MVNRSLSLSVILTGLAMLSACSSSASDQRKGSPSPSASPNASVISKTEKRPAEQKVTIDSPDGIKLIGSFYSAAKSNSPALLLLHQWQSDRHSYDEFAQRMQADGYN